MKRNRAQNRHDKPQSPAKEERQMPSEKASCMAPQTRSKATKSAQDPGLRLRKTRPGTRSESSESETNYVNDNNKHYMTPLKTKTKASKCEGDDDVHSVASCSVTPKSKLTKSKTWSPISPNPIPYYLGPCSQELPEVCWDYNSPKNSQKRPEKPVSKATIDDLLSNLKDNNQPIEREIKAPIKILDKWLAYRNNSPTSRKVAERCHRKLMKKRYLMKDMKAAFNSIAEEGDPQAKENNDGSNTSSAIEETSVTGAGTSGFRVLKRTETCSSFEDDSVGFNSDEDLWGDEDFIDDEVIVKATQDFETCLISHNFEADSSKTTQLSPIPETMYSKTEGEIQITSNLTCDTVNTGPTIKPNEDRTNNNTVINCMSKTETKNTTYNQDLNNLEDVLLDVDWESNLNDCDWTDDDSSVLLDTLSRVPEDALNSQVDQSDRHDECAEEKDSTFQELQVLVNSQSLLSDDVRETENTDSTKQMKHSQLHKTPNKNPLLDNSPDLFPDVASAIFNDDCFADDACDWLEAVDSQSTSPKYSEDDIARKKQEALKRLKEKQKKSNVH